MADKLDPTWLLKGHFDQRDDVKTATRTLQIRDALDRLHGAHFQISMLPRMSGFRHTYYWREGSAGEPEAQFIAHIEDDVPVMCLGLSIEKGEETKDAPPGRKMDRKKWDWAQLAKLSAPRLARLTSDLAASLGRPVSIRITAHKDGDYDGWTYSLVDGTWYERRVGAIRAADIVAKLGEVDKMKDSWSDVWIVCDLTPSDVARLDTDRAAELLYRFQPLRKVLHRKS